MEDRTCAGNLSVHKAVTVSAAQHCRGGVQSHKRSVILLAKVEGFSVRVSATASLYFSPSLFPNSLPIFALMIL